MSGTEERIEVGQPLPLIATATAAGGHAVRVSWSSGARAGKTELVDLSPVILTLRHFRRLRADPPLFATVAVDPEGCALIWDDGAIEMAATTVERLALEAMTNDQFRAFLARNRLTLDAAAATLGISRRQAAYFAKGKPVPRLVALACTGYEARMRAVA